MRTRKEIEEDNNYKDGPLGFEHTHYRINPLLLETLLDIRELLANQERK